MIIARDYQSAAIQSIFKYFQTHTESDANPIVAIPTGAGKSYVNAGFLEAVYLQWPNQRILCGTHVKELIEQNYKELLEVWPFAPAGIYSAGLKRKDTHTPITFVGIASVAKKAHLFGHIDLFIIDECHLVSPEDETMYRKFISALLIQNPFLRVIGLTATPWRVGQGLMTEEFTKNEKLYTPLFTDICFDMTSLANFNWLINEGYLLPVVPRSTKLALDADGIHTRGGEYIAKELEAAFNREEITRAAISECLRLCPDKEHWLVFCSGVDHAEDTARIMNDMGILTGCVHGKMSKEQRDSELAKFKAGEYRAITNNNVLTTGFNYKAIDLIVMLRHTMSTPLWVQMIGRGTRPDYAPGYDLTTREGRLAAIEASDKQYCVCLDFAMNSKRLGPVNDPVIPRPPGAAKGEAPMKVCPTCDNWIPASRKICGEINVETGLRCTHEFIFETKITTTAGNGDIIKTDMPVVEVFKITQVSYERHKKAGKPPGIRISYFCGLRTFSQFILLEHGGFPAKKSRDLWRERGGGQAPENTEKAFERLNELKTPTHLRVWVNKQYPEILAECYDGKGWSDGEPVQTPEVEIVDSDDDDYIPAQPYQAVDDDIPF